MGADHAMATCWLPTLEIVGAAILAGTYAASVVVVDAVTPDPLALYATMFTVYVVAPDRPLIVIGEEAPSVISVSGLVVIL